MSCSHRFRKKLIKQFGERSVSAMFKEYQKSNDKPMPGNPVFGPISNEELRSEDKKKELEAVNLINKGDMERPR